jgi:hypothetical protein
MYVFTVSGLVRLVLLAIALSEPTADRMVDGLYPDFCIHRPKLVISEIDGELFRAFCLS